MPRYKPIERHSLMLAFDLDEQIVPGSYAFALDYLADHELDLSALDARFNNDEVGASAYDPRVMLKIVLLACSRGLVSSRVIEQTSECDVQFVAISGDNQPSHAHIAKFVSGLGDQSKPLFAQVLMICDQVQARRRCAVRQADPNRQGHLLSARALHARRSDRQRHLPGRQDDAAPWQRLRRGTGAHA